MENPKKITTIGGQALMEGIMMVGPKRTVAAFCDEEGNISTEEISVPRLTKQYPLLGKPFIRGIFALADSFRMGYKALSLSADKLTEGDEEELTGLDKWLNDHLGEKITGVIMAVASVLGIALAVSLLALLLSLNVLSVTIAPSFGWYLFCGFCMALSIIAPGMSFSTLLMPLGLYTPLVDGIGNLDFGVLVPAGIGALVTIVCLAKAINALFTHFYSCAFHAIVGIVIAATLVIIPFGSFTQGVGTAVANIVCLVVGVVAALALDKFNQSVPKEA